MRRRISRARAGFTLVEIMMVVMIIGMLLAIAAPGFARARDAAVARACQRNLKEIEGAKERWAMDTRMNGGDTPTMFDLVQPQGWLKGNPECGAGGRYVVGSINTLPTCTVGGVPGEADAHVLP